MSSETTSAAEDFGTLKLTDEEVEAGAVMVELDVPDDTDPVEFEDALTRALKAASDETDIVFESADEWFSVEALENEGVEAECPLLPGFFATFCHVERSRDAYNKEERKYRIAKKIDSEEKLSPSIEEGLTRNALFGNSVIAWRGLVVKGRTWPFDHLHYNKLWDKRRFRQWALVQIAKLGTGDSPALEAIRKN